MTASKKVNTGRVSEITDDQWEDLIFWRDRYLRYGITATPTDRDLAETALLSAYRERGLPPPEKIIWVPSPIAGEEKANEFYSAPCKDRIQDSLRQDLFRDLRLPFGTRKILSEDFEMTIGEPLFTQIWDKIGSVALVEFGEATDNSLAWDACYGQFELDWLARFQALKSILGLTCQADPGPQLALATAAGFWWPFEDFAIISERPTVLTLDADGFLHSETPKEPALMYSDGWGLWAENGSILKTGKRFDFDDIDQAVSMHRFKTLPLPKE